MQSHPETETILRAFETGIHLTKCQQCGCMRETLELVGNSISALPEDRSAVFRDGLPVWEGKMKSIRYACLGCEQCYAGMAQNAFTTAFPQIENQFILSCEIQTSSAGWPQVVGEYFVVDSSAPVAVTTLASPDFSKQLADQNIPGMAIVGKLETENIGIDKLIKNTIANPNLRFLILAGIDPKGHLCGQTLLALFENGVDENRRVIGSNGKRPILRNVTQAEIDSFRNQIQVIDLIGCECVDCVTDKVVELRDQAVDLAPQPVSCGCSGDSCQPLAMEENEVATVFIDEADRRVKLDRAGYFVILPIPDRKVIHVEHYGYDNRLLHIIEGASARPLYLEIIEKDWVSEMSHAAYLGKELAKAESNLVFGIPYNQDAA